MTQSNKPLPRFLLNLLDQLDSCGSDPVILRQEDAPTASKALFAKLIKQGLFKKSTSHTVACISCDGIADVSRAGLQGEKLTAVCGECASVYPVSDIDLIEYRTDWNTLTIWLSDILGTVSEHEPLSDTTTYIGNRFIGDIEHEIFIARQLNDTHASKSYQEIAQALNANKPGMVYSLTNHPTRSANKRLSVMPLSNSLKVTSNTITSNLHIIAERAKDPVRQAAGRDRVAKDPAQQQKSKLKEHISKNIGGKYRDMYHTQIKAAILADHKDLTEYKARDGQVKTLSGQIILDAAREVMTELSMTDWISGKAHRH